MRVFFHEPAEDVAAWMTVAVRGRYYDPAMPRRREYLSMAIVQHRPTGSQLMFSRDVGHHTSGWWKNPEYERCFHLSICYRDPETGAFRGSQDWPQTREWLRLLYGDARRFVWTEPPYSPEGKSSGVWHFRVFTDPMWQPFLPRGEVYSKELTEAGWKSYSEVQELRDEIVVARR